MKEGLQVLAGILLFVALVIAAENTIQLYPATTGDVSIVNDISGIVRVTADTAGTINVGTFKTFPVDLKDYTAATTWAHLKSTKVGTYGDAAGADKDTVFNDSLNTTFVLKTADNFDDAASGFTLRTDSLTNGDTGSVAKWIGTCAGFVSAAPDSLKRYIWWEVTICDSMEPDTNFEGGIPIFDFDFDFSINPKR
jgi:hypothetical protein